MEVIVLNPDYDDEGGGDDGGDHDDGDEEPATPP
jgi:hypothetical protein